MQEGQRVSRPLHALLEDGFKRPAGRDALRLTILLVGEPPSEPSLHLIQIRLVESMRGSTKVELKLLVQLRMINVDKLVRVDRFRILRAQKQKAWHGGLPAQIDFDGKVTRAVRLGVTPMLGWGEDRCHPDLGVRARLSSHELHLAAKPHVPRRARLDGLGECAF